MIIPGTTYCLVAGTDRQIDDRRPSDAQCTTVARVHTYPPLSSHSCCADCSKSTPLRAPCDQWSLCFMWADLKWMWFEPTSQMSAKCSTAGGSGKYWSVSRLLLLIRNRWMSRLPDPDRLTSLVVSKNIKA